ncbi:MAG: hypothetical protein WA771_00640 [Chthoniobacterales bacterium]
MRAGGSEETREREQSLWLLTASPLIWTAHFLACYLTAAVWCAKFGGEGASLAGVRVAFLVFTVVALLGIAVVGWIGWRRHSYGAEAVPHEFDTPGDRHRFLGFATVLLAGLSAVATVFVSLVAIFVEVCW